MFNPRLFDIIVFSTENRPGEFYTEKISKTNKWFKNHGNPNIESTISVIDSVCYLYFKLLSILVIQKKDTTTNPEYTTNMMEWIEKDQGMLINHFTDRIQSKNIKTDSYYDFDIPVQF